MTEATTTLTRAASTLALQMTKILSILFIAFLLPLLSSCSDRESPTFNSIEFGVFKKINNEKYELTQTKNLSVSTNDSYGWYAQIEPFKGRIKVREEWELPTPPKYWGSVDDMTVTLSPDRRKAVVEGIVEIDGSFVGHSSWSLEASDPTGIYKMRLFINDKIQKEFLFNVSP